MTRDFCNLNRAEVLELVADMGQPAFRAQQLLGWVYGRQQLDIDSFTNVSKDFRAQLKQVIHMPRYKIVSVQQSQLDETRKILLELEDGQRVETVLIPINSKLSQCLSTQVGCRMGCTFCATASMGLRRNLTNSEVLAQIFAARELVAPHQYITNFIFMGMGEPLDNYEHTVRSIRTITDPEMMGYSHRHVTISTCGLVKGIERLAKEDLPCNLAISLHGVNDEQRSAIMPINRSGGIAALMGALRRFPLSSKKVITIEYLLIAGHNDSLEDARNLVKLLRGMRCKVNLIIYNSHEHADFSPTTRERALQFQRILAEKKIMTFIRKSAGADIDAACGQLAAAAKD
ncbi:23S rRNA (adenine(2503)-C(2))-methyltransferase RlmN [Desulfurispira natronophila]|uniref:Probable dual-specificity RNA methyltransferase RlmN n=1 Tax=Desulfurispira natronophila TaxID=682562 RepID=A0A7W8DGT8_9BACT|nr:23S rRNA (adenine(2503)-C(2))-methyltransferase RlmN [Desulfurispira natronophila]MBB5021603.1 23S rRNA (adenine2503-C2)-methyltransferase [Desulfurispira natronophila]